MGVTFLSNSSCLSFAASCALFRWLGVIEAALLDFDDNVFSIFVDAADFMEATYDSSSGLNVSITARASLII